LSSVSRTKRIRAVLIAYACRPGVGSEGGSGWAFVTSAAEVADVIVFTTPNEAKAVAAAVATAHLNIEVRPVDIPSPSWIRITPSTLHGLLRYCAWQWKVAGELRQVESLGDVDVVHHVTFASDSLPTALLASRAPVRIWGPVGGAAPIIPGIFKYLTPKGVAHEITRWIGTGILRRTIGKLVARHATLVLAVNDEVRERLERTTSSVQMCSSIAVNPVPMPQIDDACRKTDRSIIRTALFAGRLLEWKGLLLAIDTMGLAPGWRLLVAGDGPNRMAAVRRAEGCGVADRVRFLGKIDRSELFSLYAKVDALLFPSFHDAEGWVAAEASAFGCPVVCLDVGGPKLWAGKNAHVVQVKPASTLPARLAARLEGLEARGVPEVGLYAARLPPLVSGWYGDVPVNEEAAVGIN
jgi:glycosyltransferase involved in cell wall biosynthesis